MEELPLSVGGSHVTSTIPSPIVEACTFLGEPGGLMVRPGINMLRAAGWLAPFEFLAAAITEYFVPCHGLLKLKLRVLADTWKGPNERPGRETVML